MTRWTEPSEVWPTDLDRTTSSTGAPTSRLERAQMRLALAACACKWCAPGLWAKGGGKKTNPKTHTERTTQTHFFHVAQKTAFVSTAALYNVCCWWYIYQSINSTHNRQVYITAKKNALKLKKTGTQRKLACSGWGPFSLRASSSDEGPEVSFLRQAILGFKAFSPP